MNGMYKKGADRYPVPERLMEETALKMWLEREKMDQSKGSAQDVSAVHETKAAKGQDCSSARTRKPRLRKDLRVLIGSAGLVAAALILVFTGIPGTSNGILTPLPQDRHIAEVELERGMLHFAQEELLSIPATPGFTWNIQKTTLTGQEYEDYLCDIPVPPSPIEGCQLIREAVSAYKKEDGTIVADCLERLYETSGGGEITVRFSLAPFLYKDFYNEPANSTVGDTPVFVLWDGGRCYTAQFKQDGLTCLLTSEGLSQEEFINFLIIFFRPCLKNP